MIIEKLRTLRELQPGERLLYVELTRLTDLSIERCLSILVALGYAPQLHYLPVWKDGETHIRLYALLKSEFFAVDQDSREADLDDELEILIRHIPSDCIRCPRKLHLQLITAA